MVALMLSAIRPIMLYLLVIMSGLLAVSSPKIDRILSQAMAE